MLCRPVFSSHSNRPVGLVSTSLLPTLLLAALALAACSNSRRSPARDGGGDADADGDVGDGATDADHNDASVDSAFDPDAACASVGVSAEVARLPVDIIWVIDNSGSMEPAIRQVQDGLNAFAARILASGLDYRVIILSLRGPSAPAGRYPVCIPPPLAGDSSCGDGTRFFQSTMNIKSTQPLEQFLGTLAQTAGYADGESRGGPPWQAWLRPEATKTIVVVTDDNSRLTANEFEHFSAGVDPFNSTSLPDGILAPSWGGIFDGYLFDAIYGWNSASDATEACVFADGTPAAASGETYTELVRRTGGVRAKICDGASAWGPFFDAVASSVEGASRIDCELALPPPPDAMMLDASKVNVVLGLDGVQTTLPRVPEGGVCPSTGGWHYDSDATPTQVILCPTSCDTAQEAVRSAGGASVDVQFGCDSLLI